jgi:hypothetical protein
VRWGHRPHPGVRGLGAPRLLRLSRLLRPRYAFATHSVVSPRPADGCFGAAMHKPSSSRPTASAAPLLSRWRRPTPKAKSNRPASAMRVIATRGEQSRAVDDRDDPFAYQAGARRTIAKATKRNSATTRC